mmetsp:Transcript_67931/g.180779  ORF Transcript_67931/g.180779 Transcript_67931/m.180779 type:complete len:229 (-) Transcript_67931:214-900(-)
MKAEFTRITAKNTKSKQGIFTSWNTLELRCGLLCITASAALSEMVCKGFVSPLIMDISDMVLPNDFVLCLWNLALLAPRSAGGALHLGEPDMCASTVSSKRTLRPCSETTLPSSLWQCSEVTLPNSLWHGSEVTLPNSLLTGSEVTLPISPWNGSATPLQKSSWLWSESPLPILGMTGRPALPGRSRDTSRASCRLVLPTRPRLKRMFSKKLCMASIRSVSTCRLKSR